MKSILFLCLIAIIAQADPEHDALRRLSDEHQKLTVDNRNLANELQIASGCQTAFFPQRATPDFNISQDTRLREEIKLQKQNTQAYKKLIKLAQEGAFDHFPKHSAVYLGMGMLEEPCFVDSEGTMNELRAHLKQCEKAALETDGKRWNPDAAAQSAAMALTAKIGIIINGDFTKDDIDRLASSLASEKLTEKDIRMFTFFPKGTKLRDPIVDKASATINIVSGEKADIASCVASSSPSLELQLEALEKQISNPEIEQAKMVLKARIAALPDEREWMNLSHTAASVGARFGMGRPFPFGRPNEKEFPQYKEFLPKLEGFKENEIEKGRTGRVVFVTDPEDEGSSWFQVGTRMNRERAEILKAINSRPKTEDIRNAESEVQRLAKKVTKHFGTCVEVLDSTDPRKALQVLNTLDGLSKTKKKFKTKTPLARVTITGLDGKILPPRFQGTEKIPGTLMLHPQVAESSLQEYLE